MKINALTVWRVALASHETYHMAAGKTCGTVDSIVLRLDADTGLSGWGEVCPIPHYLPAYAGGVLPAVAELADQLIGHDFDSPESAMARLDAWLPGHVYAKSAIDIALWDLFGKALGVPLAHAAGRSSLRNPSALPFDYLRGAG
jgi:L-alanine-DL-glutamate epimerase-like enolase superfamily enzyme